MTDKKTIENLVEKYILNICSREELNALLQIIQNEKEQDAVTEILKLHWKKFDKPISSEELNVEDKFSMLMKEIKAETAAVPVKETFRRYIRLAAAATIVCLLATGAYFLLRNKPSMQVAKKENLIKSGKNHDVLPGKNTAILTLSDGSSVVLDEAQNGTVSIQGNTKVLKLDNGVLSYNTSNKKASELLYNTVSTPKGGQYQLMLSDGSKVWLNAASSLKFPATFTGKERKVELLGEAYFEVARNAAMPFKVEADGMEVEVLGTHFNINSYDDESIVRTTLLEGSVKINGSKAESFLKPGQQAKLNRDGEIRIIDDADIDEAVAWKEGRFQFNRADIHEVMRQIARWYNVSIEYKGIVSIHFGGTISRDVNLSQVLKMLQLTGEVKFHVEDRKVVVIPNVL